MAQINKGTNYSDSGALSQVTHINLNQHVDNASLLLGAVSEQTITSVSNDTDLIVIAKSGAAALNSQTKSDFTKTISTKSIDTGVLNDLTITANDGNVVTGSSYTSGNGLLVTVTSNAHGLLQNQQVLISASSNPAYNGYFRITSANTNTFTYELNQFDQLSGTGTFNSANGILVTVTTSGNHGFSSNQLVKITTNNSSYNGVFTATVTSATIFTYVLVTTAVAASGNVNYVTPSAIDGSGTLSYKKLALLKNNSSESIAGSLYVVGTTDLIDDLYVKGDQINDGTLIANGTVTMNGAVNVVIPPTSNNHAVNKYYVDNVVGFAGYKTGQCFSVDNNTLYKTTSEFLIPADETWVFEFHCHWKYAQGGNTRPDQSFTIVTALEKLGVSDVVVAGDAACSTAYNAQARAFVLAALTNTTLGGVAKKLKFTTTSTNVDSGTSQFMISFRKFKTADLATNSSIL